MFHSTLPEDITALGFKLTQLRTLAMKAGAECSKPRAGDSSFLIDANIVFFHADLPTVAAWLAARSISASRMSVLSNAAGTIVAVDFTARQMLKMIEAAK